MALHRPHFARNPVTEEGHAKWESALRAQALQIHPACCPVPVSVVVAGAWPSFLERARSWPGPACKCKETAQCNASLTRKLELKFCPCAAHCRAVQNARWTYILAAWASHPWNLIVVGVGKGAPGYGQGGEKPLLGLMPALTTGRAEDRITFRSTWPMSIPGFCLQSSCLRGEPKKPELPARRGPASTRARENHAKRQRGGSEHPRMDFASLPSAPPWPAKRWPWTGRSLWLVRYIEERPLYLVTPLTPTLCDGC